MLRCHSIQVTEAENGFILYIKHEKDKEERFLNNNHSDIQVSESSY